MVNFIIYVEISNGFKYSFVNANEVLLLPNDEFLIFTETIPQTRVRLITRLLFIHATCSEKIIIYITAILLTCVYILGADIINRYLKLF